MRHREAWRSPVDSSRSRGGISVISSKTGAATSVGHVRYLAPNAPKSSRVSGRRPWWPCITAVRIWEPAAVSLAHWTIISLSCASVSILARVCFWASRGLGSMRLRGSRRVNSSTSTLNSTLCFSLALRKAVWSWGRMRSGGTGVASHFGVEPHVHSSCRETLTICWPSHFFVALYARSAAAGRTGTVIRLPFASRVSTPCLTCLYFMSSLNFRTCAGAPLLCFLSLSFTAA
mmetsp:Transcript_29712/g.72990  ORF Transcript_29712/g.72990 Transcript_29712/m.72990 type:complete len:232 (-) Transcript_29712:92-787(-)